MTDIKKEMKIRTRLAKGLTVALQCDVEYVTADVNNYDLLCLNESLRDMRDTLQKLTDTVTELDYLLYLTRQEDSRELHTPL